jgi:ABC-type multidrug transport system ATPase subunit
MHLRTRKPLQHAEPSDSTMLEVSRVSKSYGDHLVLDDVTLQLKRGDIALLVGANGSGKSTLMRAVAGLTSYQGSVRVLGADPKSRAAVRRQIGYLPQLVSLPESVTVIEVVEFFARLRGVSFRKPADLLDAVPLPEGFLPGFDKPLGALSGGMRRRVALAAALLGSPPLVLLDEPAASLDEEHKASLWETLQALRAAGGTALIAMPLLVTSMLRHDLASVADRAVMLDHGKVIHDGSVQSLRPAPPLGAVPSTSHVPMAQTAPSQSSASRASASQSSASQASASQASASQASLSQAVR